MDKRIKNLIPTGILLLALSLIGGILWFLEFDVYWSGFISMMVFYAIIFYLGTYAANLHKSENIDDMMLAGRQVPLGIAVFTMSATWVGGGYINGSAEYTSSYGLAWVQAPWGYAMSLIIGGLFFARKMRRFEFKTMLDPLAQRFGKRMAAVLFIPALMGEIFWTSAILVALGTTFGTVLGLDFSTSIVLSAIIAIAYTALGGLWAVALTDVVQMILLLGGLALVIPYALSAVGGWDNAWASYSDSKGALATLFPPIDGWRDPAWGNYYWNWCDMALVLIFGGIPWQVYFQRVLSSKTEKTAMWLSIFAGVVCIIAAVPAIMIGVIGDVVSSGTLMVDGELLTWASAGYSGAESPADEAALTLPFVMRYLTPPVVATIGLGAIAAAVMSSVDSSILSASSMMSWNVYRPLVKPNITSEALGKVIKKSIWIIGLTATLLALQIKSVYELWFLCSDFVFCILFPQLVMALFDKKANLYGSIAGVVVAFVLRFGAGDPTLGIPTILPYPMIDEASGLILFPFRTLAMVSSLVTIIVVSRLTQKMSPPVPLRKMGNSM